MVKNLNHVVSTVSDKLAKEVSALIETAKGHVARQVNASLVILYWKVGQKIHHEMLKEERAEYGEQVIKQLAQHLAIHYGRGFNARALFRMVRFIRQFPERH